MTHPLTGKVVEFRFTQCGHVAIRVNGLDVGSYLMPDGPDMADAGALFTTLFELGGFKIADFDNYYKEPQ